MSDFKVKLHLLPIVFNFLFIHFATQPQVWKKFSVKFNFCWGSTQTTWRAHGVHPDLLADL